MSVPRLPRGRHGLSRDEVVGAQRDRILLALAEAMYGGEQNLITINMSEFQEAHTVSTLTGAPPGYVCYG